MADNTNTEAAESTLAEAEETTKEILETRVKERDEEIEQLKARLAKESFKEKKRVWEDKHPKLSKALKAGVIIALGGAAVGIGKSISDRNSSNDYIDADYEDVTEE